jgi:hypothetical protein
MQMPQRTSSSVFGSCGFTDGRRSVGKSTDRRLSDTILSVRMPRIPFFLFNLQGVRNEMIRCQQSFTLEERMSFFPVLAPGVVTE